MALTTRAAALVLLGIVPVVLVPEGWMVLAWLGLVALLVAADLVLAASPTSATLTRSGADVVRLGEHTSTTLVIENTGRRRMRGWVRDGWPPSAGSHPSRHRLDVPGGERRRVTTTLAPTRRGDRYADRVTVRLAGPLGLAARQRSVETPGRLRVLHPFPSRRHLPSRLAVLRELDGRAAVRTRGAGTEFDSLRDYVDGDDVRSIDWRATARRQHLVVRTWQPEQHRRIVIVIDTGRMSAARVGDAPRLDAAMDAALLLTALAGHARDRVTVIAGDRAIRARVSGSDRVTLLHNVISTLAPIDARVVEADWSVLAAEVAQQSHRSLVVLLSPLEPAPLEEGLLPALPALTAHHRVVLASVADPTVDRMRSQREGSQQVWGAVAAERGAGQRADAAEALRRVGVDVLDAPPDDLPVRLADHYLALKRQGLL